MSTCDISLAPTPGWFHAARERMISLKEALSELIDNSLDQKACNIAITWTKDTVAIRDDGNGCNELSAMLQYGHHRHCETTKLGRYGVGLKDVALWISTVTQIASTVDGILHFVSVNWESQGAKQSMDECKVKPMPPVSASPALCKIYDVPVDHGTCIKFIKTHRRIPNTETLDSLVDGLSYRYYPAIADGTTIKFTVNGRTKKVDRWRLPELSERIEKTVELSGGKSYHLIAGLTEGWYNHHKAFSIAYKWRILESTDKPAKGMATKRFFAYVLLDGNWTLTTHKETISRHADQQELYDSLFDECEYLLDKAESESKVVFLNDITEKVKTNLDEMLGGIGFQKVKEKRPWKPGNKGTRVPTGTNPPRSNSTNFDPSEPGSVNNPDEKPKRPRNTKRPRGINIYWENFGTDEEIGKADIDAFKIDFNLDHPSVQNARENDDSSTLMLLASFLIATDIAAKEHFFDNELFQRIENKDAAERVCYLMALFTKNGATSRELSCV